MKTKIMAMLLLGALLFATSAFALDLNKLQKALKNSDATWTAGETSLSDMTPEEMSKFLTLDLDVPDNWEQYVSNSINYTAPKDMPTALDWRDVNGKNFSTPIKDQHPCGTCQTFCFMAAVEALLMIQQDNDFIQPNLSEQHVYSCDGFFPYTLFHPAIYMVSDGAADEACMPYNCQEGYRQDCAEKCTDWQDRSLKIEDWQMFMFPDPETLKGLLQYGPIVAGFQVFEDFQYYTGGVYEHEEGDILGGHGVAVFGYGEDSEGGYWICKNSWGTEWGEDGWFRIRWGSGLLGFGYQSMSITVTADTLCGHNEAPAIANLQLQNDTLAEDEDLMVSFTFTDKNANLAGGELWYSVDGGAEMRYELPLIDCVDTASTSEQLDEYALTGPFGGGQHTLSVWVTDTCGSDSNVMTAEFTAGGDPLDDDDDDSADDDDDDSAGGDDDDDDDDDGCGC